jgi:hypothetical protein
LIGVANEKLKCKLHLLEVEKVRRDRSYAELAGKYIYFHGKGTEK